VLELLWVVLAAAFAVAVAVAVVFAFAAQPPTDVRGSTGRSRAAHARRAQTKQIDELVAPLRALFDRGRVPSQPMSGNHERGLMYEVQQIEDTWFIVLCSVMPAAVSHFSWPVPGVQVEVRSNADVETWEAALDSGCQSLVELVDLYLDRGNLVNRTSKLTDAENRRLTELYVFEGRTNEEWTTEDIAWYHDAITRRRYRE